MWYRLGRARGGMLLKSTILKRMKRSSMWLKRGRRQACSQRAKSWRSGLTNLSSLRSLQPKDKGKMSSKWRSWGTEVETGAWISMQTPRLGNFNKTLSYKSKLWSLRMTFKTLTLIKSRLKLRNWTSLRSRGPNSRGSGKMKTNLKNWLNRRT